MAYTEGHTATDADGTKAGPLERTAMMPKVQISGTSHGEADDGPKEQEPTTLTTENDDG